MQVTPLSADELCTYFHQTLKNLLQVTHSNESYAPVAMAVALSGGSDSRALGLLAQQFAQLHGMALHAIIIDHGLRSASAGEAADTATWAKAHGITPHLLPLNLPREAAAIQERARDARYRALIDACHALKLTHLLIGHHGDDQVETILFRLLRGSGLHGLAGMSICRQQQGVWLLRPLIAQPKAALVQYLEQRGEGWIEDPSNRNQDFARVRLREWLAHQASPQQRARLWAFGAACGRIRQADEIYLNELLAQIASLNELGGFVRIDATKLVQLPEEIAGWLLRRLLICINGDLTMPRQGDVQRLYESLRASPDTSKCLHNCLILNDKSAQSQHWILCREPARIAPMLPLASHQSQRWDHRFEIICTALPSNAPASIGALGQAGIAQLASKGVQLNIPKQVQATLPAIWHLEAVVALPHIDYYASDDWRERIAIRFAPAKALADTPFYFMNEVPQH